MSNEKENAIEKLAIVLHEHFDHVLLHLFHKPDDERLVFYRNVAQTILEKTEAGIDESEAEVERKATIISAAAKSLTEEWEQRKAEKKAARLAQSA